MSVVVIGAGVIGLSVATELARKHVEVTVVEQCTPGVGTSATTYAWINANNKEPLDYYELNLAGMEAHHRLAHDERGRWIEPSGHIELATDPAHQENLDRRVTRLRNNGYEAELITPAQAQHLAPDLIVPHDGATIAYYPREAYCYPQLYLAHLLSKASELGVRVLNGAQARAFDTQSDRAAVRLSDGTVIVCDQVVSCVGRWTEKLLAKMGITLPMAKFEHAGDVTVGYLAVTNPVPALLSRLLTTSQLNVRPDGGGRLMLQALDLDSTADPHDVPSTDSPVAIEMLHRLASVLNNTGSASVLQLIVGQRAIPADGLTVAGRLPSAPWLYVVATHSGVTLAPLLGKLVAAELTGSSRQKLLAAFRPDRLLAATASLMPQLARRPGQQ